MKNIYSPLIILFCGIFLTSCVTGNDDNAVLSDLEAQYAKTPRVEELLVDGEAQSRDQQSHWLDFPVSAGDQIEITAIIYAGEGAESVDIDFSRSYHHTTYDADDAMPVEPMTDRIINFGSGSHEFSFTYTVPDVDDEGEAFTPGSHINLTWWSSNNLGGQGFNDINLVYE